MNIRTWHRPASFVAPVILSIVLAGCSSKDDRARDALAAYQAAAASGDLGAARQALSTLVSVDEDNPEYWVELGQLHAQAGAFNDAYYALQRAHELDRSNASVLQALTQLALRGGALDQAEDYAEQLELLSPADPAVKLTKAYVALRRNDTAKADIYAEQLLATSPYDSNARILKARTLLRQDKGDAAIALLSEQVQLQPSDLASLRALIGLLERRDDWPRVVTYGKRLLAQLPDDLGLARMVVEAALRSGDLPSARQVTLDTLSRERTNIVAPTLLDTWARLRPATPFNDEVRRLAAQAPEERKLVLAAYLNSVADPQSAARIVEPLATLPVTAKNVGANAIYAAAIARMGKLQEARERLDKVLSLDPGHIEGLKARIDLALRLRQGKRALEDAQRLVSVAPAKSNSWITLASVYAALGNQREAERTLWNAFHQISADRNIYDALRVYVARSRGPDAVRRLDEEFSDQRDAAMTREFA